MLVPRVVPRRWRHAWRIRSLNVATAAQWPGGSEHVGVGPDTGSSFRPTMKLYADSLVVAVRSTLYAA